MKINLAYYSITAISVFKCLVCPSYKGKVFYGKELLSGESTTTECGLTATCSNVLKQPNGELLVAVNHSQLRIMASYTVDPIDWSHPHPHGQYSLSASNDEIKVITYLGLVEL